MKFIADGIRRAAGRCCRVKRNADISGRAIIAFIPFVCGSDTLQTTLQSSSPLKWYVSLSRARSLSRVCVFVDLYRNLYAVAKDEVRLRCIIRFMF
jgi:hypothetical protein